MKKVRNKQIVGIEKKKLIRKLFFQKVLMKQIEFKTQLTERIIRRIIRENNWIQTRERYYRMLCQFAITHKKSLNQVANDTGTCYHYLCKIRKKYNKLIPTFRPWNGRRSDSLEQQISNEYQNGKTAQQIVDEIGYKRKETVYQVLDKLGVERREAKTQTYYDESFFEEIDSHKKAYILGLIMSDGNIIKDYLGFEIQLTEEDGYILEKISHLIGASRTHPVQKICYDNKRKVKGFSNAKDMMRLTVHNKKIAKDLKRLGVLKRKTHILRYNGCVPDKFFSSFFRGLIDGDGTVGIDKRNYPYAKLCSASHGFIVDLASLGGLMGAKFSITKQNCSNGNIVSILNVTGGKLKIFQFLKTMYNNKEDFYLRRKYEKVQSKII